MARPRDPRRPGVERRGIGGYHSGALAPVYSDRDVTPFDRYPLNSYLVHDPEVDLDEWRLSVTGLVQRPGEYGLNEFRALPRVRQNTRHICVEGWDVIGSFGGVRLSDVLTAVGADRRASFSSSRVRRFRCHGWSTHSADF